MKYIFALMAGVCLSLGLELHPTFLSTAAIAALASLDYIVNGGRRG